MVAIHLSIPTPRTVTRLANTPTLPAVAAEPATTALAAVAALPATTTLDAVAVEPATAVPALVNGGLLNGHPTNCSAGTGRANR